MGKKLLVALLTAANVAILTTGCNKQLMDVTYSYDYAIINLGNGEVIEGKVQSWTDFADGDQIQVKIDGKNYLVHSSNVTLISEQLGWDLCIYTLYF